MAEQKKQKASILKDALILFLITVVAGGLLGLVNQITKDPIEASKIKAKEEAYKVVLPTVAALKKTVRSTIN